MTRTQRSLLLGIVVIIVIAGFFIARGSGGGDDGGVVTGPAAQDTAATQAQTTTTGGREHKQRAAPRTPKVPVVTVKGDQPVGGIQKLEFAKGGTIDFKVRSVDVTDEIHFHGYDIGKDVEPGGTVRFRTPAKFDGRFEVELESKGIQIAEVEVTP